MPVIEYNAVIYYNLVIDYSWRIDYTFTPITLLAITFWISQK